MSDQETTIAEELTEEVVAVPPESEIAESEVTPQNVEPVADANVEATNGSEEESLQNIHDLEIGQQLSGTVKNIAPFGAFVDVGIPQDGLVHISKLARHKVESVSDVVSEGQEVDVWVKKVDTQRGRLSLTMIKPVLRKLKDIEEGTELQGTVTRLESYGAFVDIDSERDGLIHISQITHDYIKHPEESLKVGDTVTVKVISVNRKKRQVDLSIKALLPEPVKEEVTRSENPRFSQQKNRKPRGSRKKEQFVMPESDEPKVTAMAAAYAALQQDGSESKTEAAVNSAKNNRKKEEIDSIVARTLASRE